MQHGSQQRTCVHAKQAGKRCDWVHFTEAGTHHRFTLFLFFFFEINLSFAWIDTFGFIMGSPLITNFGIQRTNAA